MIRTLLFLVFTLSSVQGSLDSRIVGGNNAWEGKYPYQVLIKYQNFPMCGGSIISNRYILTAAHCIYNKDRYLITITAGTIYSSHSGDTYAAEKLNWPSNYNEFELIHDIGLILVNGNITFNSRVQPVALASTHYVPAGEIAVVTGWGRKRSYLPGPATTLQELRVTVILQSECKMYWFLQLKDNNICTLTKKDEGTCNGDSGGPLVLNGEQIGIVSYGHPCAEGVPDVYTRVYPYRPWIESVMNDVNHVQLNTWTLLLLTILTLKSYSCSLS